MRKLLCITVVSGYRTKITVVTNYRATITVHYRGGWLPYKVFRGCQLPSTNYCAIPWWLLTAVNVTEESPAIFYRDASSALLQLANQWLNFTYSRSHVFRYERKNANPTLVRIELTTFALAGAQVTY